MFNAMNLVQTPTGAWMFKGLVHEKLLGRAFPTEAVAVLAAKFVEQKFGGLPINQIVRNN
jgi:hypothetical protein